MRVLFRLLGFVLCWLAAGALLGLLAGWPFGFAGSWFWWAGGGAVVGLLALIGFSYVLNTGPDLFTAVLLACVVAGVMQPSPAAADALARIGADWVRITARPCANEAVLGHIPDLQARLDYRAATAHFQGKDFNACWTPIQGGIRLLYEDGDQGAIPVGELKPVPEA